LKRVLINQKRNAKECIPKTHPKGKTDIKRKNVGKVNANKIKCCAKKMCDKIKSGLKKFINALFKAFNEFNDSW
jgi:hypothetical protein